jgi:hypothetical protein
MKRTLPVTAALLALMMIFAACQDPVSDYSLANSEILPEIAGPEWVKAVPLKGANRITWALTKDAKGYSVYRQKVDTDGTALSAFVKVKDLENPEKGEYIDAVTLKNQLEDGALYRYGVIAYTEASLAGRAAETAYVKDGVTYADPDPVTATIPDQGTVVTELGTSPLTSDGITTAAVKNSKGEDELLVSWPSAHPVFKYNVSYALGNATVAKDIVSSSNEVVGDPLKYFHTPLFGGNTQIELAIAFEDDYYYKPATITKTVPSSTLGLLNANLSFSNVSRRADGSSAAITWYSNSIAPNAGDYKLYRTEAKNIYTGTPSSNSKVEVVGDWVAVTGVKGHDKDSMLITVIDIDIDPAKSYLYALYAEVDGKKSEPVFYGLTAQTVYTAELDFDIQTSYTQATDGTRTYSVAIGWNAAEGATGYTLAKAVTTKYPTVTTGAYVPVTVPAAVNGRYTVIDDPAIRQAYKYRLTATVNGVTVTGEKDLASDPPSPFAEYIAGSGNEYEAFSVIPSATVAYATEIDFSATGYTKDITADIYRAEVPKNLSGYAANGYFNDIAIEQAAFGLIKSGHSVYDGAYTDTGPTIGLKIGTQYIYRVEFKVGTKKLYESSSFHTGFVQIPSVPQFYSGNLTLAGTWTMGSGPSAVIRKYYTVSEDQWSNVLTDAQIVSQMRTQDTNNNWSDWTADGGITTLALNPTGPNAATVKWTSGSTTYDTGITAGSYYFYVTVPTVPAKTQYRLVLVDKAPEDADNYTYLANLP